MAKTHSVRLCGLSQHEVAVASPVRADAVAELRAHITIHSKKIDIHHAQTTKACHGPNR